MIWFLADALWFISPEHMIAYYRGMSKDEIKSDLMNKFVWHNECMLDRIVDLVYTFALEGGA